LRVKGSIGSCGSDGQGFEGCDGTLAKRMRGGGSQRSHHHDRTRKADIGASGREHVRGMVRGVGVHGMLVTFGSADVHHQCSTQDFECRGIAARCPIPRGSFVIDHHPTLHRSQRGHEAEGGGYVSKSRFNCRFLIDLLPNSIKSLVESIQSINLIHKIEEGKVMLNIEVCHSCNRLENIARHLQIRAWIVPCKGLWIA